MLACAGIVMTAALAADPVWSDRFYAGDFHASVRSLLTMSTPDGPRLVAGGALNTFAGEPGEHLGMWDGERWERVSGLDGSVQSLAVYDDGTGPALFVGGWFDNAGGQPAESIARWDGKEWSPLGLGVSAAPYAMVVHDDGRGPALFVGGIFTYVDGEVQFDIGRWDGSEWSVVGVFPSNPPNDGIYAMTVFDDGGGDALFVGGRPTTVGGNAVAKWDGYSWTDLGNDLEGDVRALAAFDDGNGEALYAAGDLIVGGSTTTALVKRSGNTWVTIPGSAEGRGRELFVHDQSLYLAGTDPTPGLRRWDGKNWDDLDGGPNWNVYALASFPPGPESRVVAGGAFTSAGGVPASEIAAWDGVRWTDVGSANTGNGVTGNPGVFAMHEVGPDVVGFDERELCMTGAFRLQGPRRVNYMARWDGREWDRLGDGLPLEPQGQCVATFGEPPMRYLYAAAGNVYRWDGAAWSVMGDASGTVFDLCEIEIDGTRALYAGGRFTTIDGVSANRVARFDGTTWHPLGDGVDSWVFDMASFEGALVVGGRFTLAGGQPANRIARWDGAAWSPLGDGVDDEVYALKVPDIGEGEALYVGGQFQNAGGVAAPNVARWDGKSWAAVGSGTDDDVWSLASFDDGRGNALYVGGNFSQAGGVPAESVARYDGQTWEALDAGVSGTVYEIIAFEDQAGPALYVGGAISTAGGYVSQGLARWGCAPCAGDADGDRLVGFSDVLAVLANWGPCSGCPEDLNADADVGFAEVIEILGNWGPCD